MADNASPPAEIAPGVPAPQFVTNQSAISSQITAAIALVGFAITFATTMLSFVNAHDLVGAVNYLQSAPAIGFLTSVVAGGIFLWRMIRRQLDKKKENSLAAAAPAAIAMTTEEVKAVTSASTPEHAQEIVAGIDAVAEATRNAAAAGVPVSPTPTRAQTGNES